MKQFLYTLKVVRSAMLTDGPNESEQTVLGEHVAYLDDLLKRDIAILFGRTDTQDESTFGLVIFEAESESEARAIMQGDPCVRDGVMVGKLFPYRVAGMRGADSP